jgi:hypothetical protein
MGPSMALKNEMKDVINWSTPISGANRPIILFDSMFGNSEDVVRYYS